MQGRTRGKFSLDSPVAQCIALGAAIFAIDLFIPLGAAEGVLYTAVVLIALRLDVRRDILIVAALCTLLILIGFLFSPSGGELWKVVFNRFLSVLVVWTTTVLSLGLRSRDERVRSERQFRTLFDLAPDAYYLCDLEGRLIDGNVAAEELLGYKKKELAGKSVLDLKLVSTDRMTSARTRLDPAVVRGEGGPVEYVLTREDGSRVPIEINSAVIDYGAGEAILSVARDISEQVAAETKLRESETRFRAVFEQSPCAIVISDAETMLPMEYNARALELLEYEAREFCHIPVSEHEAVQSSQNIQKRVAHVLNGDSMTFETRIRTKRGALKNVLVNGGIIDLSGQSAVLGIFQDITDQKRAEERLQLQSTALDAAANAVFITDPDGSLTWVNSAFSRQSGYSLEEVRGKNMRFFKSGVQKKAFYQELWGTILSGRVWQGEVTNRNKKGQLHVEQMTITPVVGDDGQILNYVGIKQDMTEHKRLEREAELRRRQLIQADKMVSLGVLVSGVAHEINNPIHATMIHAGSLQEVWRSVAPVLDFYYRDQGDFDVAGVNYSEIREEIPNKIEAILSSTRRIESIVGELQDYAREQPSDMTKEVRINRVVASSCALLSNMLKNSTAEFVVDYGEGMPIIRGNFQRIEQVIVNLLQNACQALRSRLDGIFVSTYLDEDSGYVCVAVSDEGVGIPRENIEKVTDPFFTTRRESRGTGLGLSIAANIVMEHMGRLSFASFPGGGTTVIVALPPAILMQSQRVLPRNGKATLTEEPVNEAAR